MGMYQAIARPTDRGSLRARISQISRPEVDSLEAIRSDPAVILSADAADRGEHLRPYPNDLDESHQALGKRLSGGQLRAVKEL